MKKRALSLFLALILCLGLLPLPAAAATMDVPSTATWTATTAGGKTINQSTYSDKIQVLVFFPVTRIEDDMGPAYAIDVQKLWAWEDLAAGGKVQVVAIGVPSGVDSDTTATARDLKNFMDKFRLTEKDGFTLAWMENNSIAFDYADEAGITLNRFCANYVVDSQRHIRAAWSGDFAPEQYSSALKELGITVNVPSDFGELVIPWTATTAGGQTIDQDTYSDKIQILVFFQVTRYEDGTYCLASQSTIQRLWAWEDLVASGKVQVVALGVPSGSRNSETGFSDITATAQDLRDFMDELGLAEKDGFTLAWVEDNYPLFFYERAVGIDMGSFCHNYVIDPQGNICAARWGAFYPAWYSDALQELDITAPWEVASGYCGGEGDGTNLSWTLTGDGALTISGTGKMEDYSVYYMEFAPWFTSGVKVRTVDIREGVTNIGEDAFCNCRDLTVVSIPASLTTIGQDAFSGCDALTRFSVAGRNSNYASADGVLFNRDKTTLIQYPAGNGRTTYKVPDGVTTIGEWAFVGCQNLTNVTLPDSLTTVDVAAFWDCNALTGMDLPESLTTIGERAFAFCYDLDNVTIPASVTTIGEGAFYSCDALTDITVAAGNPAYAAEDGVLFNKEKTTLIWYPVGNTRTTYAIPDGVTTIDDLAFCYSNLTGVTFPESLTTIGAEAFESCESLTSVTFPKNVTTIGDMAFEYCEAMTEVKFMGNAPTVRTIEAYSMASNDIELLDMEYENGIFSGDILTAYYPQGNSTWTEQTRAKLGENADITWVPFDAGPSEPETYTVTVWSAQHGKVTASPAKAEAGTKVTLTVTPDKGYELDTLTVKQANGKTVAVAADNTFTMPASDVTVTPTFKELPPATYTVTVTTAQHGKVTADPTSGTAGTKVTLTVTPDSGYELDTLTVKQADGKTVTVAADNTFTMPASDVTVTPTFKELPSGETLPYDIPSTAKWSFPTLTGEQITQDTYAGQTVILIFYRASGLCFNSNQTMQALAQAEWLKSDQVKVVAVGCGESEESEETVKEHVTAFREEYAPGCEDIQFCYATRTELWDVIRQLQKLVQGDQSSILYAVNYVFDSKGNLRDTWQGGYAEARYLNALALLGLIDPSTAPSLTYQVTFNGTDDYDSAYQVLELLNSHRRENGLSELVMDQELLATGMRRAEELALYYSHTRPDGTSCFSAYPDLTGSARENIAAGYTSPDEVMTGWKNSPGHNENMLGEDNRSVGIGVFVDEGGIPYWVQNFSSQEGTAETSRSTGKKAVTVTTDALVENLYLSMPSYGTVVYTGEPGSVQLHNYNIGSDGPWMAIHATYVASSDESIVTAALTEDGTVALNGHSAGQTVVKIGLAPATAGRMPLTINQYITVRPSTYTVTVADVQNGEVAASPAKGTAGTEITLIVRPDSGYELDTLAVTQADGTAVEVTDNSFTMPAANVTVTPTFKELPPETYTVTVTNAQHGKVTASPAKAEAGTKVTLTVTPDSGYELDTLTVKQSNGTAVKVTNNTFTMPASNVTVTATFKALPADKLSLNKSSVSVSVGSSASVTATVSGYAGKHVYAISSDASVATASVSGKTVRVKGVAQGTATIYVAMTDAAAMTLEQVKADPSVKEIKVTVTKATTSGGGGSTGGGGGSTGGSTGGGSTGGSSSGGSTGGNTGSTGSTGSTTTPNNPATQTFTDVVKGSWYEPGVTFVVGKGLFNGVGANKFAPNDNMTRAMLMTVLARLAGQSTDGGATWYSKGMDWAKAQGVSDGTAPEGNITREQLVTMLYRYAKSPAAGAADMAEFVDANAVSDWAADAVRWAVRNGILTGKDGARLDPQGTATRAEVATILQRYVELVKA